MGGRGIGVMKLEREVGKQVGKEGGRERGRGEEGRVEEKLLSAPHPDKSIKMSRQSILIY